MKQSKKRWAWTARQVRKHFSLGVMFTRNGPDTGFIRNKWKSHRGKVNKALHHVLLGRDEAAVTFPYQHQHQGRWDWD